jgi:hypothetical protein
MKEGKGLLWMTSTVVALVATTATATPRIGATSTNEIGINKFGNFLRRFRS